MRLTKATYDQLDILTCVYENSPACMPVSAICEQLNLSNSIGLKLVNRLVHAKLLRAKRGPGGGTVLARPASKIGIGVTIRQLEAMNAVGDRDLDGGNRADRASKFVGEALSCFLELLDNFTLEDLAGGHARLEVANTRKLKLVGRRQRAHHAGA
jgi:DNA-binding IscR family transcriptional regulator